MANIPQLRSELEKIDKELLCLLARRMELSRQLAPLKKHAGLQTEQPEIWQLQLDRRITEAVEHKLNKDFVTEIFTHIHTESVRTQLNELAQLYEKID